MKTTTKLFLICCITIGVGFDSMAQENISKEEKLKYINRILSESEKNDELRTQEIMKRWAKSQFPTEPKVEGTDGEIVMSEQEWQNSRLLAYVSGQITDAEFIFWQSCFDPNRSLDFSKFTLEVETNKSSYRLDEPIDVRLFIRNVSDEEMSVRQILPLWRYTNSALATMISLKNEKGDIVPIFEIMINGAQKRIPSIFLPPSRSIERTLKPGERFLIYKPGSRRTLDRIFDLGKPGKYELTFGRGHRLKNGTSTIYDSPKPATTSFEILSEFYVPDWPEPDSDTIIDVEYPERHTIPPDWPRTIIEP